MSPYFSAVFQGSLGVLAALGLGLLIGCLLVALLTAERRRK